MSVSFNEIGNNLRVPFVYVEFDNSNAQQGPSLQPYMTLILGQKLSTGSATALDILGVTSEAQAISLFGDGSMAHLMVKKYLEGDKVTELKVMPLDDDGSAVKSTGKITVTAGTSLEDGVASIYIAGKKVSVSIATGDDQDVVAASIVSAINAVTSLPMTAVVNGTNANEVDLTAKNGGLVGDQLDVRYNYLQSEVLPSGIDLTVTAMAGGAADPDLTAAIAALTEDQYNIIVHAYTDATSLTALETEMADRFGPIRQNDGMLFAAKNDSLGNLQALGNSRNSPHSTIITVGSGTPSTSYEVAAAYGAQVAKAATADMGRPFQTLQLIGILQPTSSEQFSLTERNLLLHDGIATAKASAGGVVRIERSITTFQKNAAGADDVSYLDVNTLLILSFLRYDFRNTMLSKFPRHKLGSDGTNFAPGQKIITPKIGRAEAVSIFNGWVDLGLVEDLDQFKRDLIVERNAQDVNRMDFLLPPNLINQFRVGAAQIQFLL